MIRRTVALTSLSVVGIAALVLLARGVFSGVINAEAPDERGGAEEFFAREMRDRAHQIGVWERAAARDTSSALALAQLAGLYLQRSREVGDYADVLRAEAAARRSLAIRTNRNARTFSTLVAALVAQHRFADALPVARQMVAMDPELPSYRSLLGEIQMEVGDYAGARASFEAVRGATASPAVAARIARWDELNGRDQDARRLLNNTLLTIVDRVDVPSEQVAWFFLRLGEHDLRLARWSDARAAFRLGLDRVPEDHRLLAAMAKLEAMRGRWRRAIDYGERAIVTVLDPATLGILADAHAAIGDGAKAADLRRALEVSVRAQPGAYHRAWSHFLLDHGRVDDVARLVEQDIESRRDVYAHDLLAWTRYRQGRLVEATAASREALSLGTGDALPYYHAGMIASARGDRAAARRHLSRALRINERFHHAHADSARAALKALGGEVDR
jgi:tetratricopeptide (TPR) repeat protein